MKESNEIFYTRKEVMEILRCSHNTLNTLTQTGKIKSVQFIKGGRRLYPKKEIEKIATIL